MSWRRLVLVLPFLLLAVAPKPAAAQVEENLGVLEGDSAVLYLGPLSEALSGTLNSAIFRSGDVPLLGVSLTVDAKFVSMSFADEDNTYSTIASPGYGSIKAPTVIGDTGSILQSHDTTGAAIIHPGGFDIGKFAVAVPQITIGNVAGTRAMIRWISLDLGDTELGDFSLFGIGGQHSISRYFPGLPVSLAAGVMYQSFNIGNDIVKANAFSFNVTGSKVFGKIITVEPYVGLGIDSFKMEAEYTNETLSEDIKVDFDRDTNPHLTLGAGVNLPIVKLHAELDFAAKTGYGVGVSFGI